MPDSEKYPAGVIEMYRSILGDSGRDCAERYLWVHRNPQPTVKEDPDLRFGCKPVKITRDDRAYCEYFQSMAAAARNLPLSSYSISEAARINRLTRGYRVEVISVDEYEAAIAKGLA